jgi:transposase
MTDNAPSGRAASQPFPYLNRDAIERIVCRLKDFRRAATRHDRNAVTFLATVCIVAAVSCRL